MSTHLSLLNALMLVTVSDNQAISASEDFEFLRALGQDGSNNIVMLDDLHKYY